MALSSIIEYDSLDNLFLDPLNPRLGVANTYKKLDQDSILELMRNFTLDELAQSFIENKGFWVQEALIVVEEPLYSRSSVKVVVEGNRRLAALKLLEQAVENPESSKPKFLAMIEDSSIPDNLFSNIPYIKADSREDINAFLGFRHVTGIKEWYPEEKAEFIAKMVDAGVSFEDIRKKIGSKTPTVRYHYIANKVVKQLEDSSDEFDKEMISNRFSVLYLALQKPGVQEYLNINMDEQIEPNPSPIKRDSLTKLNHFGKWIFGDRKNSPLFSDSRETTQFSQILQNKDAVKYLETAKAPTWDQALIISGVDLDELIDLLRNAIWNIQYVLSKSYKHKDNGELVQVAKEVIEVSNSLETLISQ